MTRRTRPYLFYDTTTSLCAVCLRSVEAKIVFRDEEVFLDKWCPVHGAARVLIADDLAYYRAAREIWLKPPEVPERFATPMKYGCPFDCGLCPDHMQHACLAIVELTDHCNLRCPVCYAGSGPERTESRSRAEIEAMLDAVVATEGEPDVVQLSGGEPTLHPEFLEIVRSAKTRPIRHLMINTNGIRIAREPGFAEALADLGPGIEIYLQFDSQRSTALHALRGADLLRTHEAALDALDRVGLSTTLVATLRRGVNDDEVGSLIRYATTRPCVRGVTFQPVQDAGRNEGATPLARRLTVTEIRRRVAESGVFTLADVVPVPCNPDTLAMAYAVRTPDGLVPLTRYLPPEALLGGPENTIAFERIPGLGERLFGALSTGHSPESRGKVPGRSALLPASRAGHDAVLQGCLPGAHRAVHGRRGLRRARREALMCPHGPARRPADPVRTVQSVLPAGRPRAARRHSPGARVPLGRSALTSRRGRYQAGRTARARIRSISIFRGSDSESGHSAGGARPRRARTRSIGRLR